MASDLPLFIVEMYTPGEIVEARRTFDAETAADALLALVPSAESLKVFECSDA